MMNLALVFLPVVRSVKDCAYFELMRELWIQSSTVNASTRSHVVVSFTWWSDPRKLPNLAL